MESQKPQTLKTTTKSQLMFNSPRSLPFGAPIYSLVTNQIPCTTFKSYHVRQPFRGRRTGIHLLQLPAPIHANYDHPFRASSANSILYFLSLVGFKTLPLVFTLLPPPPPHWMGPGWAKTPLCHGPTPCYRTSGPLFRTLFCCRPRV